TRFSRDWSSDVCSSDLEGAVDRIEDIRELRLSAGGQVTRLGDIAEVSAGLEDPYQRKFRFNGADSVQVGVVMAKGFKVTDVGAEIGRASCRERVEGEGG